MNNATIVNTFNCDNSDTAYIRTQNRQIIEAIATRILKVEPLIKKTILTNHSFFTLITFANINYFT